MKSLVSSLAFLLVPVVALAGGTHSGGGNHNETMAIGKPAEATPDRTIQVVMKEDHEGEKLYFFEPEELSFAAGETVLLRIVNEGEEEHEFVMDTVAANAEHRELMAKFPEMEHDDPNSVRLQPGQETEISWTFSEAGTFEFACLLPGHYESGMYGPLVVN